MPATPPVTKASADRAASEDSAADALSDAPAPKKPRHARRAIVISSIAVVAVAAVVGGIFLAQPPAPASAGPNPVDVETVQVTRGDLSEDVRAQGKLAYGSPHELGTSLSGTVTALPGGGTVIARGQELFRIDDNPVILMLGELPVWRGFDAGMSNGRDVLQLENNLQALGFFDRTPDEKFDWNTTSAIQNWQKSLGMERTGSIDLGRVVFSPTELRVQGPKVEIGAAAGPDLISVTSTTKEVQAFIDTAQQSLAEVGAVVTVMLPGGVATEGTITGVGAPVEKEGSSGKSLKNPVTLTLNDPEAGASLDNVSVSIMLTQVKATDTLLVPVSALLAQPGGGFAVEVVKGKAPADGTKKGSPAPRKLVTVELGAFASGFVSVTGGDLAEGDTIVVAK
ncbi:MAG TPA: peptidoglycan-binding protein [Microbacteriaceae bacterium]|nr:peptidoglycan-binding protein [Microbacteriaceae bacterium]